MRHVYLDLETTSLDPGTGQVWEASWAIGDGEIQTVQLMHSLTNADAGSLRINGYLDRVRPVLDGEGEMDLRNALSGSTVVGANPAFDTAMLYHRWRFAPWHYRLLDVEAYAMPRFGWYSPRGLADLVEAVNEAGGGAPIPNHSSAQDVEALRAVHRWLQAEYHGHD